MTSTFSKLTSKLTSLTMTHSDIDAEEQTYLQDVEAVKQWWTDSRWRYTKRAYTAELIVQKRGNLKIDYPSNVQAKKLWNIMEERFAVRNPTPPPYPCPVLSYSQFTAYRTKTSPLPMAASNPPC